MTINEIQDEIIDEFASFDEWMGKYEYIIELGKSLAILNDSHKTYQNLISGCQSQVWLHAELKEDKIVFSADSDAIITKGIIALLLRVFSNQTPEDILQSNVYFIKTIGLQDNLSPTRANGLLSMLKQIKIYAMAFDLSKTKIPNN